MSLINFLNPKLKPAVECDAICEDGYTAANLIADDAEQAARGFMAFSVTKPPVEIIFEFPKAIDLKVIKLWNSIGAFRSTAFEVHGKYEGIWERVAAVRDLDKGIDSLTFCYQSDYSRRQSAAADAQQPSEKVFFFRSAHKLLSNTKSVKIIIRGTQRISPPVLKKVQIWGFPARSLDKADRELIRTIWSEIKNPLDGCGQRQQSSQQSSPSRQVPELNEDSSLKIPEEFLDAITWELMIFPTVLPSGKIVDQSTIDKHSEVEAKWGRMPSDPFTGLEFTQQRKAILNLALKARIEKYLHEHSDHFKTVPRSLGSSRVRRARNRHASQFASAHAYFAHNRAPLNVGTYTSLSNSYKRLCSKISSATLTTSRSSTSTSRTRDSPSPTAAKRIKISKETATTTATQTSVTATASATASLRGVLSSCGETSPGETSIDVVVQKALQQVTRYTIPITAETTMFACCIRCKSKEFAYEIQTCRHLVCRDCLVLLTREQMCVCKTSFQSADVERYHML